MKNLIYILLTVLNFSLFAERQFPGLDNSQFNLDLSSRVSYFDRQEEATFQEFIGFDFQTFISFNEQDVGNLILQPYINRIDNGVKTPSFYDDGHDWEFLLRTATFTFTGFGPQYPWLKIGHFELPFGLDHRKDTNGKLHQYSIAKATGLKIDWGMAIGQEFENWHYELALTRGSGVHYRDRANPGALLGRIGRDFDTWSAGFSFFKGDVLKDKTTIGFESIAIDLEYYYKQYGFLTEVYIGTQDHSSIVGGLVEVNWRSFDQTVLLYSQIQLKDHETLSTQSSFIIGTEYAASANLTISGQVNFAISQIHNTARQNVFEIQFRYKF
jgi:hypothetical protein